ncbi:hypothetical protein B0H19DRAFT_1060640 [Mycena capillaripes]|nr:hypothetical protein B0H19DRAFT_1060640 [Mycena capillaripes]
MLVTRQTPGVVPVLTTSSRTKRRHETRHHGEKATKVVTVQLSGWLGRLGWLSLSLLVVYSFKTVVTPVEASSSSAAPAAVEKDAVLEELSAASIAIQSAHGMESPVVEEILADLQAAIDESASTLFSSVSMPCTTDSAEVVEIEPVLEGEEDDVIVRDFLGDLGLASPEDDFKDKEEDKELSPIDDARRRHQQAQQQAAAKERRTKEERVRIMGLMAKSKERLQALAKVKNKALRKMLVGMRKGAVSRLDDPRMEVGGAVRGVTEEGDKLLAGTEAYLRTELKANKAGGADVSAKRTERWETVVRKVEERLQGSIQAAEGVLQAFHAEEKAQEVEGGMEMIQEVRDACGQAQGDVGLDLGDLDDVTPADWQVYHDLMRIGNDFQAEASAIQAGTHAHPPVDPFLKRLGEKQAALSELVEELAGRIDKLREQAERVFAPQVAVEEPVAEKSMEPEVMQAMRDTGEL